MEERINLVVGEPKQQATGVSLAVAASFVFHAGLVVLFIRGYRPIVNVEKNVPIARYVELIKQNPREFVEAPGPKTNSAPITAPHSDANRRASMPKPTGPNPTARPGEGGFFRPPMGSPAAEQGQATSKRPAQEPAEHDTASQAVAASSRIPALRSEASAASGTVNWRSAIREVGQIASIAGEQGIDLSAVGGEKGFAEAGPLSFETQWYDWGEYAQSMVSRIRVNWYNNMPVLIRTGIKGVVTIRFTIHRNGRITDVVMLSSSGHPPYDFAARKAIELSSPLNPLPSDFPNLTERVTAMFYYNSDPPAR